MELILCRTGLPWMEVQLELVPHYFMEPDCHVQGSNWSQFLMGPGYWGQRSSWNQFLMELDYLGRRSSWSWFLMETDYHGPRSSWSLFLMEPDYCRPCSWSWFPRGPGYRGQTLRNRFLREPVIQELGFDWSQFPRGRDYREPNFSAQNFPLQEGRFYRSASPVELKLVLWTWLMPTVELELVLCGTGTTDRGPTGVSSSWNRATEDRGPAGISSSWKRTTTDGGPAGVGPWGGRANMDRNSGTAFSGNRLSKSECSAGASSLGGLDYCEVDFSAGNFPLQEGRSIQSASPVELELVLWTWLPLTVLGSVCASWEISETSPVDSSPLGVEITADTSPAGASSLQNCTAVNWADSLLVRTDRSGDTKGPCSHADTAPDSADTAGSGSAANWMDGTAAASQTTASMAQAGMEQVVTLATHRVSETGSRPTQLVGLCTLPAQRWPVAATTQNCSTAVDPAWATKSHSFKLACQYQTEIWWCHLFLRPWRQICRIQLARCTVWSSTGMCKADHRTWQLRWWHPVTDSVSCMALLQKSDSQVTQNCHAGEDSSHATKSLPVITSLSGNSGWMVMPSVAIPNTTSVQNSSIHMYAFLP